ncbi:MAG: SRPBCC family protein [Solirubrobacterales bacterium]
MQNLVFLKDFDLPPEKVFAFFSRHENLGGVLGAEVTRIKDGTDGDPDGVGSVRRLKPPGPVPAFEETTLRIVPNEEIDYAVTRGTPLKDHLGEMRFTPKGSGTHLEWKIMIDASIPGLDFVIGKALLRTIGKGLDALKIPA